MINRKVGLALHLISSCINLEEELEVRSIMRSLKESEFSDDDLDEESNPWDEHSMINDLSEHYEEPLMLDPLFENDFMDDVIIDDTQYHQLLQHRGKPDPEKARERQESHKRGLERHKNALDRSRREELLRKSREAQRRRNKNNGKEDSQQQDSQQQDSQQEQQSSQQQKQQQSPKGQQQVEVSKQEKMLADTAINKVKKSQTQLGVFVKNMVSSAPTANSKAHAKKMSDDISSLNSGFNKGIVSAEAKLTPGELKRRKQREREAMSDKYDEIESKYLKKMDSPEERLWFKKNFSKLKRVGVGTVDNVCDMMGYKAVYTDIANATKFLMGKSF